MVINTKYGLGDSVFFLHPFNEGCAPHIVEGVVQRITAVICDNGLQSYIYTIGFYCQGSRTEKIEESRLYANADDLLGELKKGIFRLSHGEFGAK